MRWGANVHDSHSAPGREAQGPKADPHQANGLQIGGAASAHQKAKKLGQEMLEDLASLITKQLRKGNRVRIVGLGIFQVRKRAARMGRNPATGEAIQIKASKKVAFRASKELKESL